MFRGLGWLGTLLDITVDRTYWRSSGPKVGVSKISLNFDIFKAFTVFSFTLILVLFFSMCRVSESMCLSL